MNTVVVGLDDGTRNYLGRREQVPDRTNDPLAKAISRKWERMKAVRRKTEDLRWEACAFVNHRCAEFNDPDCPIKPVKLYNTAGIQAFETFINGYHGNLITPAIRWFRLTLIGENYEDADTIYGANDFLELCENQIYTELNKSDFYPKDKLATKDAAVQGTSAEWIIDDVEHGLCVYETLPPWDFWIDRSRPYGPIDTLFYRFTVTSEQALDRFGEKTPDIIRHDVECGAGDTEHVFLLAVYPRKRMLDDKGKTLISTEKRFAAVTYFPEENSIVEEGNLMMDMKKGAGTGA